MKKYLARLHYVFEFGRWRVKKVTFTDDLKTGSAVVEAAARMMAEQNPGVVTEGDIENDPCECIDAFWGIDSLPKDESKPWPMFFLTDRMEEFFSGTDLVQHVSPEELLKNETA